MKLLSLLFLAPSVPSAIAENLASTAETTSPDRDVSYIRLSAELASVARDARDPLLMLAAAVLEETALIEEEPREKSRAGLRVRLRRSWAGVLSSLPIMLPTTGVLVIGNIFDYQICYVNTL